jgi:hypothetical protein
MTPPAAVFPGCFRGRLGCARTCSIVRAWVAREVGRGTGGDAGCHLRPGVHRRASPELLLREFRDYAGRRGFAVRREYVDQTSGDPQAMQ